MNHRVDVCGAHGLNGITIGYSVFSRYWHRPHSTQSRVYVTIRCPSVCLSVPFARLSRTVWPAPQQHGAAARHAAADADSATFTADVGS